MGWFRGHAKPPPAPEIPDFIKDSTEDWHAGDVAVAIGDVGWCIIQTGEPAPGPTKGDICRVLQVRLVEGRQFLNLAGYQADGFYAAANFKKLRGEDGWLERAMRKHAPRPGQRLREPERVG